MVTKKSLKGMIKTCGRRSVKAWVIRWVCESVGVTPTDRLSDLSRHGCGSGIVSELIYTNDCVRFYDRFEASILEIVDEFLDSTGETFCEFIAHLRPEITDLSSLKTTLAWFAVEETAYRLLEEGRIWLSQSDRVSSQQANAKWSETNQISLEGENS
ncbi:hypothetical protein EBR57_06825 [bacterium]|nr:hypothetical protein [bacterium]